MQSYDSLLDSDPYFQKRVEEKAEEKAEKRAAKKANEREVKVLQQVALEAVEEQFPALMPIAKAKIALIKKPDLLRLLVKQIYKAPDEKVAQLILDTYTS